MTTKNRKGQLLISHPNLPSDNFFYRSVVYIYEDGKDGTLGVVINKHTDHKVKDLCKTKGIMFPDSTRMIFQGGPVNPGSIVILHTDEWSSGNTMYAGGRFNLSSDEHMFTKIAMGDQPAYYRVMAGISAWGPGQLDMELNARFPYTSANSWLTATANDSIIYEYDGDEQWNEAVKLSSQQMIHTYF